MQTWSAPTFVEIIMSAEVGAYQNELDEACGSPLQKSEANNRTSSGDEE